MNKWAIRIFGLLMLLAFALLFLQMQKTLVKMQQERGVTTTQSK
ncbi:MAG TPA: hypothetical protein VMU84_08000 [Thermoanaerobaculia bacterium]|nr:hypothetical protein [Thermoanaerobaculia bacterium]